MIDLTIHPDFVPRTTTRERWAITYREYRGRRKVLADQERELTIALCHPSVPKHVRKAIADRLVNAPVIIPSSFAKQDPIPILKLVCQYLQA